MDFNTKDWQQSRQYELIVQERILRAFPGVQIIETDKNKTARIDALILRQNNLVALAEIKSRDLTYEEIKQLGGTWLVSNQKMQDGATLSSMLKAPFFAFVLLVPENKIHYWKITNENGQFQFSFAVRRTKTQQSMEGGEANRPNAFIPFSESKLL